MIQSLFCFTTKVNLGKFTFTISITNLRCKYLMKPSLLLNFVLHKVIIPRLSEACQLPHKIVCCQATVSNDIEALCILLLKRLIFAVCLTWYHFWEETLQKFVIFNYILEHTFTANLISSLVLGTKIFYSPTNWQNCFGSVC